MATRSSVFVAVAVAALVRRRRKARATPTGGSEWVSVPVETSAQEAEEALGQGSPVH